MGLKLALRPKKAPAPPRAARCQLAGMSLLPKFRVVLPFWQYAILKEGNEKMGVAVLLPGNPKGTGEQGVQDT